MKRVARTIFEDFAPPIASRAARKFQARRHPHRDLGKALAKILPTTPGYYVELGANDGLTQSNTYWLERARNWRGLLIEPALNRYFELRLNRSHRNSFACAACVPLDYSEPFVEMSYADLMSVPLGLASNLPDAFDHLESARQFLRKGEDVVNYGARAMPLQQLLDNVAAPDLIDFCSLDVEGAEIPVLQGVDHERTSFRFILVESRNPRELSDYLGGVGYVEVGKLSHHDYLFRRSPVHPVSLA